MTKLEFIRKELGLTQKELAKCVGVSNQSINLIERGYVKPWPKIRKKLNEHFGYELFDEEGWPLKVQIDNVLKGGNE